MEIEITITANGNKILNATQYKARLRFPPCLNAKITSRIE